ncbi:MAG TPA: hypothetical protein VKI00_27940 [Mycobacterium sp.]|uniref:hypothetical protein n=1 Tax=Mycobacterium sp. TaxID=1785 RepID=UPI002B718893|nr:hypothetical protein [Mycobacterium sp.]HME79351.1 hypothetical protein [Mycobacterium sp.]
MAAMVEQVQDELGGLSPHPGAPFPKVDIQTAVARLEQVREVLRGGVALFYADSDMECFSSGRPVMGRLRMCDGSQYLQPWHPDPVQEPPREIRTVTT